MRADQTPLPIGVPPMPVRRGERERLPTKRRCTPMDVVIGGHQVTLSLGHRADGSVCEVFIDLHKEGASFRGALHVIARLISAELQIGMPVAKVVRQLKGECWEPSGMVEGHESITRCTSIVDFIAQAIVIEEGDSQ
jgi:ribonucleoside-diphosphate reductase alpha chain